MIVICTKCQAKFRVADEKIGARGAKVRCSKCQTVFIVRPEAAPASPAAPASGLELEPRRAPPPADGPFPSPAGWDPTQPDFTSAPPPLPPPLPSARGADPFAAAAFAPPPAAPPAADPFAPSAPDPFAPAAPPDPFAPAASRDPFAASAAPDPFAPSGPAADELAPAAAHATDLGDLLGAAASAAPAAPEAPESGPAPVTDDMLALEDRPASPPRPASSAPFDLGIEAGYDAFAGAGDAQAFDPGAFELGGPAASMSLAGPLDVPEPAGAAPAPAPRPPTAPRAAAPLPMAEAAPPPQHERIPGRPSRLRAVALNAVALAALLLAAVAILAIWRTEGPLDAGALRPSSVLAALRRGGGEAPFATREVRSGLYERDRAPPVLFVRGSVVSRSPAPVAGVRVRVEILRAGAVVATGEAVAGAEPTPEELWAARDAAALAAVARGAARRAPAAVRSGDAVPFLVAIADQPADLAGTSLRVEATPVGSAPP